MRAVLHRTISLLLLVPSVAVGQQSPKHSALSIPDTVSMRCLLAPEEIRKSLPPRATVLEFTFGKPVITFDTAWPRQIAVIFDTIGGPLYMSDEVTHYNDRDKFRGSEAAMVAFPDSETTVGSMVVATVDSIALDLAAAMGNIEEAMASAKQLPPRPLVAEEFRKARALGSWLWERRCAGR